MVGLIRTYTIQKSEGDAVVHVLNSFVESPLLQNINRFFNGVDMEVLYKNPDEGEYVMVIDKPKCRLDHSGTK